MIEIKPPKLTAAQKREATAAKTALESAIESINQSAKKILKLRKKESDLRAEAESLHRAAANFDREAEIKLAATLKQIERVSESIRAEESAAYENSDPLLNAINQAQELISNVGQDTYHYLLDLQAAALAPFYSSYEEARQLGMSSPAAREFVRTVLQHTPAQNDSSEDAATLEKLDALLNGTVIFSFQGISNAH